MFYAQLNENGVCVGITETKSVINNSSMIKIDTFDTDKLNRKYEGGTWSEIKYDAETVVAINEIEKLKQENLELKLALAELAESMVI